MISFSGKKVLVSGASSGIGREVCIQLSELGAKVVLLARNKERLLQTISLMTGNEHTYFDYDLEDIEGIKNLIPKLIQDDDIKFDGYVHCAGIVDIYPLRVINLKKFEKILKINTYSYLEIIKYLSKKAYSHNNSSIVFTSAMITRIPKKGQTTYIASKSAGESMSKVLSLELLKREIRINSVLVGSVMTQMVKDTEKLRLLGTESDSGKYNPICRTLKTREVSNMIMFLLSDSAKYIIGENYNIDGGYFQ